MDSSDEEVSSLKRKSTLELSSNGTHSVGRKSSRVCATGSVKAATRISTGFSKIRLSGDGLQKTLSKTIKRMSTERVVSSASVKGLGKRSSLARTSSSNSRMSKTDSLSKSFSEVSLTSKGSLSKSPSKASLSKSPSKASLSKSPSKASLSKSSSKTSLTRVMSLKNKLKSKDSDPGGKKLWFDKGCYVAVRTQDGPSFYLCRLQQNVFNFTKEVKVRWLSMAGQRFSSDTYQISYLDKIDPASILMQVELEQKSRLRHQLPSDQEEEIGKMISMVEDVESGKVSVEDVDDDIEEVVQIDEPPKKKPKLGKTASQRARNKASKTSSKKSASMKAPKAKKAGGKKPKEKKEPKRKVAKKEDELKLNPRPDFKILNKDPLFETKQTMPFVSKVSNSKLVYRAIHLGDATMLRKLLKDKDSIKHLYPISVSHKLAPIEALGKNLNKEVLGVLLEELVEQKFSKRIDNNLDDPKNLERLDTGRYNPKSLAVSRIFRVHASRGSKEGNNAFLHEEKEVCRMDWSGVVRDLTNQNVPPSKLKELETHFKKLKKDKIGKKSRPRANEITSAMLLGRHKEAGQGLKMILPGRHFASETLMKSVLLFDTEDIQQCPPSAVKECCKQCEKITAIHCAAANPNSKYLNKVLSVEPNPQGPDGIGRRPIHFAAGCSSPDNLKLLLKWRVNTQDTCMGMKIPLHYAILARRPDNVSLLVDCDKASTSDPNVVRYGAGGVNRPMKDSRTPLHLAAELEEVGIASILLSNGAFVNAKTSVGDLQRSPLQIAAGTGNLEMVKLLVKHGAVVEQKDRLGRTALLMACMNGATKVLSYFIHIGANPERADKSDNKPLHYAAAYGWYFTVKMMMEAGVDPNVTNIWKISPLFVAYMKGHVGIVRLLMGYSSVNINQALNDGSTLLFHACQSDLSHDDLYEQIQYMVKEKGALCDSKDANGKTALFYLAGATICDVDKLEQGQKQSIKIAQLLLDSGCDIDAVDDRGFSALMEVMGHVMNISLAEFLMKKGCQVFEPASGERSWTVLHSINENIIKAKDGLPKIMAMLKRPKHIQIAKSMAKCYNKDGYTPLQQLCTEHYVHLSDDEGKIDMKPLAQYFKFLVETLHSSVNDVVIKKYFAPGDVLPKEDSDDWFENPENAGHSPASLLLLRLRRSSEGELDTDDLIINNTKFLIKNGADLNIVGHNGQTFLFICASRGLHEMIRYVGENASCDVDYEIAHDDAKVHPFFKCSQLSAIEAFVDIGCNPNILSKEDRSATILHTLVTQDNVFASRDELLTIVEKLASNQSNGRPAFDFNNPNWKGQSVLHLLARHNPGTLDTSLELEYKVIQSGGKVGLKDKKGRTPLHYVFNPSERSYYDDNGRSSDTDATQLTQLFAKYMTAEEINTRDFAGKTALHMAAQMGAFVSCVTLLSLGDTKADVSLYDFDGNTALTLAVLNKHDACAMSLIQSGASMTDDVIEMSDTENANIKEERKKLCEKKTTDSKDKDEGKGNGDDYWILEEEKYLKKEDKVTRTPLYKAAMKAGLQGVAMMVSQASPSKSGCTPLDIIKMAFDTCHYNIAKEILHNQWHMGQLRKLDKDGRNLLHLLAISCDNDKNENENSLICKVAKFLIQEKISIELRDKEGLYPIHWAIINRHFDLADLLAESSTSYDKDPNGRHFSYLEAALWRVYSKGGVQDETWDYLKKLNEKSLDFNRRIKVPLYPGLTKSYLKGEKKDPELSERLSAPATTALILAIRCTPFSHKTVSNLLKSDANPNLEDGNQVTPMMHAVMRNDKDFVCVLLNYDYPKIPKEKPAKSPNDKKKPNTSIFRLKPNEDEEENEDDENEDEEIEDEEEIEAEDDDDSDNEEDMGDDEDEDKDESDNGSDDDGNSSDEDGERKKKPKELKPIKKTSDVDLDAKDKDGRTALHYVASPLPDGTFDNADIAFLLVTAGAKELKDKRGMTPYALAVKTGAMDVANKLKSLGHGKQDSKCTPEFNRHFSVNDGVVHKVSLRTKPDFRRDAKIVRDEEMEDDNTQEYQHKIDKSCSVKKGALLKDEEQDLWYDVLLTKVDVKRHHHSAYNFYKIQLVQQTNPSLYILFTQWGCIGETGQCQNTPFNDVAAATKEFCKVFKEKTGNKWEEVKSFQVKPKKYRLLDNSARLAPPKKTAFKINITEPKIPSALPHHLLNLLNKMMKPADLVTAMERLDSISVESLPFGRLRRERLMQGKHLLDEIRELNEKLSKIKDLDEDECKEKELEQIELLDKIAELSNDYFHVIPQDGFVYEDICPLDHSSSVVRHIQAVDNLLDYEVACQMLLGAMARQKEIHPVDYVYRCLDCKIELMKQSDPMAQLILKYIRASSSSRERIKGIYKVSREGEADKLEKTGLENRRFLFHGTSASNLLSILSRGLITIFPEHGSSYGHGIYFADEFSKSSHYAEDIGFMMLCEVALGNSYFQDQGARIPDDFDLDKTFAKKKCSSLVASSSKEALNNWFKLPSGVSMNLSPDRLGDYYSREYVVMNPDQVCIRYLIHFET